jgi:DNA-binding MarR family transcriptional regulator
MDTFGVAMTPFSATDDEELWFAMVGLRELVVASMETALDRNHGLSFPGFVVLLTLVKHGDGLTVGEVAALVGIVSRSQVSRLVDSMADQGLVVKHLHAEDGRARAVTLTSAGRSTVAAARRTASKAAMRTIGPLDQRRRSLLLSIWAGASTDAARLSAR